MRGTVFGAEPGAFRVVRRVVFRMRLLPGVFPCGGIGFREPPQEDQRGLDGGLGGTEGLFRQTHDSEKTRLAFGPPAQPGKRRIVEIAVRQNDPHATAGTEKLDAAFQKEDFRWAVRFVLADLETVEDGGLAGGEFQGLVVAFLPGLAVALPTAFAVGGIIGNAGFLAAAELLVFADVLAEGRIGEDQVEPAGEDRR